MRKVSLPALMACHLGDDMRGCPKTIYADPPCLACDGERSVGDESGAEQRRGMGIVVTCRPMQTIGSATTCCA